VTLKPWSHSALERFNNCPRAYHAISVEKSVVEPQGTEANWGEYVHKQFEERLRHGVVLPDTLQSHETYLARLEALPGEGAAEQEIAINRSLQACGYWDKDVWYRGKIDYLKLNGEHARVYDWKTGKPHQKLMQLYEYILWVFLRYPGVRTCYAEFYWTKAPAVPTGITFGRERINEIWAMLMPDLKQFAEAYRTNIWQPRQSGLCKRHCAVVECEFNGGYKL
jgi:hypothetical protein